MTPTLYLVDTHALYWREFAPKRLPPRVAQAFRDKGGLSLDRLNETEQIEVEDDYRICVRRGAAAEAKPRRQRRKNQGTDP
jgi:hypothetical protein